MTMKIRSEISTIIAVLTFCCSLLASSAKPQNSNPTTLLTGQTATLLSDGSWLLVGGQNPDGHVAGTIALRNQQGTERLSLELQFARVGHTATVLPNGTVLILGGVGEDGKIVEQPEVFDPESQTMQISSFRGPAPRAFHSATLLTEGRLLIAGGVGLNGKPLISAELWDPRQNSGPRRVGQLGSARTKHSATLLADGRVVISGGDDGQGRPLAFGEVYDPSLQSFSSVTDVHSLLAPITGIAETRATSPEDGAIDVAVDALISMRFSRSLQIGTINNQTVLLEGPTGIVEAQIVGAEGGMLAFISPKAALLPGTSYSVKFSGAADTDNATAAFSQFSFTTAGEAPSSDTWIPDFGWVTNRPASKWQSLPPLEAALGVTALTGQVLKLDGNPLQHVTLMIGDRKTMSDSTGRFLLTNIPSGRSRMMIVGSTANTSTRTYGIYEVGVEIKPNVTTALSYIIWMTPLDMAHSVKISSPTTNETVITSPLLPGLELRLPSGTVITDYHGKVVTEISITPVPLDRPPFPLPNVRVPIYFTIQPGSAYIKVINTSGSKGARLIYPNAYGAPPGTPYEFWNYDADKKGWYVYGQGQVSADRSQIIPNAGVEIYEFTGAMVADSGSGFGGGLGGPPGNVGSNAGDPVDLGTGLFIYKKTDLALPDVIPIVLSRTYRPNDGVQRAFGISTGLPYDMFLVGDNSSDPEGYTFQDLILADGTRIHFQRTSPCTGTNGSCGFADAVYQNTAGMTEFLGAIIRRQPCSPSGGWTLEKKDGTIYCFPTSDSSQTFLGAALLGIQDRHGNVLLLTRDRNSNLTKITSPNGRWIQLSYAGGNVSQAQDNAGRVVTYSYDGGGRLSRVVDANGGVWNYTYDAFSQMLSIQDPRGIFYLTNQYDRNGRVIRQTQADNSIFTFNYTIPGGNNVPIATNVITQTDVTDPRGTLRRVTFDANGYMQSDTRAFGKPEQQTITYTRDPGTNLITSMTDSLGRQTSLHYDSLGNLTSLTRLDGTANAVTTTFTYESAFNQLTSITDPLNNITTLSRDGAGNLSAITDALNHQTTLTYNNQGLPTSITDALNNSTQLSYAGSDLVGITDPLQNKTTRSVDAAGRVIAITDALNRATRIGYDSSNHVLNITDPLQGMTTFVYDPNGNLLSLTDAFSHTTAWTYDNMDRVVTRTDPLQRQEAFAYDQGGNLISAFDRKGQVTTLQYDAMNRRTFVGFGTQGSGSSATYASTISLTYDAGNRLRQAADSSAGTITRGYDDLDRMTSEATPQGSIGYTYDSAGRRASMTVPCASGAPFCAPVTYTWDNANRLTQITQASSNVILNYDDANRRSSLTLPNGIEVQYSYDPSSRLTGMSYNLGVTMLGNVTYAYDQVGHRTQMSGSFARTNLPQPVASAGYDAANELVNWGSTSPMYDLNGNMLSDGINTFSWNARNQLAALNGVGVQYDAFGRRIQNLAGTSLLYDGLNSVEEISGSTVTATLLSGGLDEIFTRSDDSGVFSQLRDGLGSTIALTDANGTLANAYAYEPYGVTSSNGTANSNAFQYTGRENDANVLYYYRARYYNPNLGRFISQDPIGVRAGPNLYAYAVDAPTEFVDPRGTDKQKWADCTLEQAQKASIAEILGIKNPFGKALLGNSLADLGGVVNSLLKGDVGDSVDSGANYGFDKGVHHVLEHTEFPGTTNVAVDATIIVSDDVVFTSTSIAIRSTESIIPALLGEFNLAKDIWDVSGLLAAGGVCAFE